MTSQNTDYMAHGHEEHKAEAPAKAQETVPAAVHAEKPAKKAHGHGGGHGHGHAKRSYPIMNPGSTKKRHQKKFNLPIIGHFSDKSVEFKSIIDAERLTGISYQLIFEACIGKIFKAKNVIWEYKKGNHYIKYKAFYINAAEKLKIEHEKMHGGGHGKQH